MKTITPEHKESMRLGRLRAAAERKQAKEVAKARITLGLDKPPEPVAPVETPAPAAVRRRPTKELDEIWEKEQAGELDDLERMVEAIERGDVKATRDGVGQLSAKFEFPESGKRPGWDYEFKTFRVLGQEVDASEMVEIQRGGWIPVPVSHFPSMVPPGWGKNVIEREGQRAYMRPMRLTLEAREETHKQAFTQKNDRLKAAETGDVGREFARRDPRVTAIDAKIEPLI